MDPGLVQGFTEVEYGSPSSLQLQDGDRLKTQLWGSPISRGCIHFRALAAGHLS